MSLSSDLRVLYHMAFTRVKGDSHADRLEAFYSKQADAYDAFRRRLLHGREEMMRGLEIRPGERMLDMGGGTGSNIECIADRLPLLQSLHIVDLCASLLRTAQERIQRQGWSNVYTVQADAAAYQPEGGPVDLITFSYSLTMMPTWLQVLEHAYALLRPGGMIGVADFYIAHKWPGPGRRKHSAFQRFFWPIWFGFDNVFLSPDQVNYLRQRFQTVQLNEGMGRVPYMLGLKAPIMFFSAGRFDPGAPDMESSSSLPPPADWMHTLRGRRDLFLIGGFVLLNLLVPLLIVDLYPFSRAPMFADSPRRYCDYRVYDPDGNELHLHGPDGKQRVLVDGKPVPGLGLHRNYWGNPIGAGVGFIPPRTGDEFGSVVSREEVTAHLQQQLRARPELAYVEVEQEVIGDLDGQRIGSIEKQRWRVENPAYQGARRP